MEEAAVKRRRRELSKQQAIYVAKRATGASKQQSAIFAGYSDVEKAGDSVEASTVVQTELAKARADTARTVEVTKEDIAFMLAEAYAMAKLMADPQAMVRAAAELGKMLGHYAPEVKKHLLGMDQETKDAIKQLSDHDLLRLARGRVINGESKVVPNDPE